ncbi:hypothetical protein [Helicobacter pylori]|uniref:hypothetical protein n=1 Tax=Helicobacter pylori TaxID=210 RepID=UPI001F04EF5A|nr:hypothetical protein [Helicobacter pylori]
MLESLSNINFNNISNNKNIGIEVGLEIQEASWMKSPFKSITGRGSDRVKNLTSATSKIYDGIKALNLGDRLIQKAQDNSGIFSAFKRFANEKTNGFIGLNSDEAETMNALKNYSYSTARQMGGQLTNQKIKDAQEMTKFGFRNKEENTARLGENQGRLIQILEQDVNNLESLGGRVDQIVMLELLKHKKRLEYIQKNQGKIKLKEYQTINPYREFLQNGRNQKRKAKLFK